ncbi:MAG: formate dehydrogenase subunit alpha [Thermodesulforhabdaceae bacterium]
MTGSSRKVSVICPYCGAGCRLNLIVENGKTTSIEYDPDHPVSLGALCPKGISAVELINHPERLTFPVIRKPNGTIRRISWDEALKFIAEKLRQIRSDFGADAVGFLASAKASNEENYLFQKLARLFGSPHVDHCARLCHAPSIVALSRAFGSGAMTNPIADLENSRCILIIGSNFSENHPVVSRWVWNAKDRGAFIIAVDPRKTPTTEIAHLHLMIKPGTDGILLNAIMAQILREGLANYDFIASRTEGFENLKAKLQKIDVTKAAEQVGVPAGDIVIAARKYAASSASAIIYCMGITQHRNGTAYAASCANLALLCGQIGRPGTGLFPLRGQNNVQGASDMGALAEFLPGYVRADDSEKRRIIAKQWGCDDLPSGGLSVTEIINAILDNKIKALFVMGENPIVSDPSASETEKALSKLDILVVQDPFMTETAGFAHIVLPAAMWAEKSGSYTNTERRIQWSPKALDPPGEAKPDLWIIGNLGKLLGLWETIPQPQDVLREINRVVPFYGGVTPERIETSREGLIWPCLNEHHEGTPILYSEKFHRENGRALFTVPDGDFEDLKSHEQFALITGRVVVHYNSGSFTRRLPSLMRYSSKLEVTLHPYDASKLDVKDGNIVLVKTSSGTVEAVAKISSSVRQGSVFMPFHFPEANKLTTRDLDPIARIPSFKDAQCQLIKKEQ